MPKITLYDTEFATMWFHTEKKIVHHKIHKYIYGEEFHKFLMCGTEAMKKYQAHKWLSDDRAVPVVSQEDMDWGRVNWFPQTVLFGWKYWAVVQPAKAIAQMNLESLTKEYSAAGVTAQFFTDPESAMKWLESMG